MKNNSFRYLHLFLVVCSLGLVFSTFITQEEKTIRREPTSLPVQHKRRAPDYYRPRDNQVIPKAVPHTGRAPASSRPFDRFTLDKKVKGRADIRMSNGYMLAQNIGAIPLSDWKPGMAPLISNNGVYGFYEKAPGDTSGIPVAYNPMSGKLNVISTVVHIQHVDEATRQDLLSAGFKEYYYFPNLQRLSVQTTPEKVVSLYDELSKLGHSAKLEVIREKPKAH